MGMTNYGLHPFVELQDSEVWETKIQGWGMQPLVSLVLICHPDIPLHFGETIFLHFTHRQVQDANWNVLPLVIALYRKAGKKYTGAKGVVVQMQQPIGTITALFSTQITDYSLVN